MTYKEEEKNIAKQRLLALRCVIGYHYPDCPCAVAAGISEHSYPCDNPARFIKKYIFASWETTNGRAFKIGFNNKFKFSWGKTKCFLDNRRMHWFGPWTWYTE